jgi:DNA-binding MarR family transcriptional regulator
LREVWALNHALARTSKHMEATLGVTAQQRMLIRIVAAYPGIAAGELAEVLHLDAGTISATVGRLEKRGLIKRRRDTEDRRRVTLEVTPKGRKLDSPAKETVEASIKRVLDATPAKEIARVRGLLGNLAASLAKNYED